MPYASRDLSPHRERALGYSPALDGLRAVAIIMVVAVHMGGYNHVGRGGWIGVNIFFVLSGFLITSLLVNESDRGPHGRFSIGKFYIRRIFRLWPAYFTFILGALFYAGIWQRAHFSAWWHQLAYSAVFYLNFYAISHPVVDQIGPLWSLCVEEQFYIVWALVLLGCCAWLTRRATMAVAVAGVVLTTAISLGLVGTGASWQRLYYGFDTNAMSLLVGAVAGLAFTAGYFDRLVSRSLAFAYLAGAALVTAVWFVGITNLHRWVYAGPVQLFSLMIAGAVVLLVVVPDTPIGRLLSLRPIVWIGKLSYSIYLWNRFAIYLLPQNGSDHERWECRFIELGLTAVFALASYYGVERWGLRFKNRHFETARIVDEATVPAPAGG
jgi:peptidoglycan/LPS O-acetylase OafA/YrhL